MPCSGSIQCSTRWCLIGERLSSSMTSVGSDLAGLLARDLQHLNHGKYPLAHLVCKIQSSSLCCWVCPISICGGLPEVRDFHLYERFAVHGGQGECSRRNGFNKVQKPPLLGFFVHSHFPFQGLSFIERLGYANGSSSSPLVRPGKDEEAAANRQCAGRNRCGSH